MVLFVSGWPSEAARSCSESAVDSRNRRRTSVVLGSGRRCVPGTEMGFPASKGMACMKRLLTVVGLLLLFASTGTAAGPSLLPDKFGNWQAEGSAKIATGKDLYKTFGDVWTPDLKEAGLRATEKRSYKSGSDEVTLTLYEFQDPSGAYQFFTQTLHAGMKKTTLGDEASFDEQNGEVLTGNLVLLAASSGQVKPETLGEVVPILSAKADRTPYPPLKSYLPEKGLVAGTQRYALGPAGFRAAMTALDEAAYTDLSKIVGFESGVESMLARYKTERDGGVLLLLEYPTPQLAEQHLHHLEEALPAEAKQAGVDVQRNASMLSLVFGAKSKEFTQELRKNVKYETEVIRNEAGQTLTDPPWVLVLSKIFFITAIFLGVATGLGIAFGGVRVLTKRLFPGKVFDRPQDIEVLQMGLSGKKIDPSDMY
jgi:hypothetical protein